MAFWSRREPEDKIGYLNQFSDRGDPVELLHDLPPSAAVPDGWWELFSSSERDRATSVLRMWKDALGDRLAKTQAYLKEHLEDIEALRWRSGLMILYSIRNRSGAMRYFVGGNPVRFSTESFTEWSPAVPELRSFYSFQDGFSEFSSGAGLTPLAEVRSIEDLHGGAVDRPGLDLRLNPARAYLWFSNAAGGYVGIDLDHCDHDNAFLWWVDDQPTYNLNLWDIVDEWMTILFDD